MDGTEKVAHSPGVLRYMVRDGDPDTERVDLCRDAYVTQWYEREGETYNWRCNLCRTTNGCWHVAAVIQYRRLGFC
jgi:hypothetical protein